MNRGSSKTRRFLFLVLRLTIGFGLAALLIGLTLRSGQAAPADLGRSLLESRKHLLVVGMLLFGCVIAITVLRWQLLLRVQGLELRFRSLSALTLIGVFFNLAIPGAVSGDLLKMAYLARDTPGKRTEAILTIVLDRVLGILGLFLIAAVMVVICLPWLLGLGADQRGVQIVAVLVGSGSLGGIFLLSLLEFRQPLTRLAPAKRLLRLAEATLPAAVVGTVLRLTAALDLYRHHRGVLLAGIALSAVVHVTLGLLLWCLGASLGLEGVRVPGYLLAAQAGNAVAAIPMTPGGMGTRDATVALFLNALHGHPASAATLVPLAQSALIVCWGLIGAVVFVFYRTRHRESAPDTTATERSSDATAPESGSTA